MAKIIIPEALLQHFETDQNFMLRSDISIISAPTVETMLKIHEEQHADLIIAEANTPEMGGIWLCKKVRGMQDTKEVSVLLIVQGERDLIDECLRSGANDLIIKPIIQQDLLRRTSELLQIAKRADMRVLMNISVLGKASTPFYSTTQNISTSGILIETSKVMKLGERLSLSFFLRLKKITLNGEIVRVIQKGLHLYQYGIRFLNPDSRSQELIGDFVKIRKTSEHHRSLTDEMQIEE